MEQTDNVSHLRNRTQSNSKDTPDWRPSLAQGAVSFISHPGWQLFHGTVYWNRVQRLCEGLLRGLRKVGKLPHWKDDQAPDWCPSLAQGALSFICQGWQLFETTTPAVKGPCAICPRWATSSPERRHNLLLPVMSARRVDLHFMAPPWIRSFPSLHLAANAEDPSSPLAAMQDMVRINL